MDISFYVHLVRAFVVDPFDSDPAKRNRKPIKTPEVMSLSLIGIIQALLNNLMVIKTVPDGKERGEKPN